MIRKPAVKGTFYPANPKEIIQFIEDCDPKKIISEETKGALIPHAGYIFSGNTAVQTIANLTPKKNVVILGPNHTGRGLPFSVYSNKSWQTPIKEAKINTELADEITKHEILEKDSHAHTFEHSIEVILPLLQHFFKEFTFVPIICTPGNLETCKKIAVILYEAAKQKGILEDLSIIASSDMTHFEPLKNAKKKDHYVIEAILELDTEKFLNRIKERNVSMCGTIPTAIMLEFFKLTGVKKAKLINYATSGEVNKDYSSVVGYAGIIFS